MRLFPNRIRRRTGHTTEIETLRKQVATLEACRSLGASLEPEVLQARALEVAIGVLRQRRGLAVFPPEGRHGRGLSDAQMAALTDLPGPWEAIADDSSRRAHVERDGATITAFRRAGLTCLEVLVIPVRVAGGTTGALYVVVDDRARATRFTPGDLEIADLIAEHAAQALANAAQFAAARATPFVDDVTGLPTRRHLVDEAEREIRRSGAGGHASVLFIDVDHFKQVNDAHGHELGSPVLRELGAALSRGVRRTDTLARCGGDEFAVLLPGADTQAALGVAERVRAAVQAARLGGQRLTVSVGVATHPEDGRTPDALLEAADRAMYRAKALGRNRCRPASGGVSPLRVAAVGTGGATAP
jgi:diguanylate cyclase (GGDEF)-like protein